MNHIFFTVTGMKYYYGNEIFDKGLQVTLIKEPDNPADPEAIRVYLEGLGTVGHVANSTYTRIGESFSAGRLYDKIGQTAQGHVRYVLKKALVCELDPSSLLEGIRLPETCSGLSMERAVLETECSCSAEEDFSEEELEADPKTEFCAE